MLPLMFCCLYLHLKSCGEKTTLEKVNEGRMKKGSVLKTQESEIKSKRVLK